VLATKHPAFAGAARQAALAPAMLVASVPVAGGKLGQVDLLQGSQRHPARVLLLHAQSQRGWRGDSGPLRDLRARPEARWQERARLNQTGRSRSRKTWASARRS